MISVVIPTYNEASTIEETLRRACGALRSTGDDFEIIVVDDSSADGTPEIAEALARDLPVRVLRRPGRRGLASAVVDGWKIARGELLGVMDADLQHPPELLSALASALLPPNLDLAIASRYVAGGNTARWSWPRRIISWGATHLAASVLPWTLAAVVDPMSGMFLVRASVLAEVRFNPTGYKILLEVLAKARYRELVEVPYVFEERGRGSSKLGTRQYVEYVFHMIRLARWTGQLEAWVHYGVVALVGAMVNVGALYLLIYRAKWTLLVAVPVAIELALISNFFWNHTLTFRSRQAGHNSLLSRFLRYERVCAPGAALNALVTLLLARQGLEPLLASAAGVLAGGVWNFFLNVPAIWRVWGARSSPGQLRAA
jgi:dolichol-phosphate mannosyltransferase